MKTTLFLVVVIVTALQLNATKIYKCDEENAPAVENYEVSLGHCKDENPCKLYRGESYPFKQLFRAPKNADKLASVATGKLYGFQRKIDSVSDDDACQHIKEYKGQKKACPLKKGKKYIYQKNMQIEEKELRIKVNVQWHLEHGNDTLTCFQIPVSIEDKPK